MFLLCLWVATPVIIYYDDYYFSNDSYTYNHELAAMSLALAMSAYNSSEAKAQDYAAEYAGKNVKSMLRGTGLNDIDISAYAGEPTQDSIGVAFGHKVVEDRSTLIAIAVRGGGYKAEWAGNFNISGYGEHHDGFDIISSPDARWEHIAKPSSKYYC